MKSQKNIYQQIHQWSILPATPPRPRRARSFFSEKEQ